jgi:hypothetical protein
MQYQYQEISEIMRKSLQQKVMVTNSKKLSHQKGLQSADARAQLRGMDDNTLLRNPIDRNLKFCVTPLTLRYMR